VPSKRGPHPKAKPDATLPDFVKYAEAITGRAFTTLLGRRPVPETDAEIAVHLAYAHGLRHASALQLNDIEDQGRELGFSIRRMLNRTKGFWRDHEGLDPAEFIFQLYRDDRILAELWQKAPRVAESLAFWQGMNDVYEFAVCFMTHAVYEDDFRNIRKAVTSSLKQHGLLRIWNMASEIAYAEFSPLPSLAAHLKLRRPGKPPEGEIVAWGLVG
jgi:hypothetical protein